MTLEEILNKFKGITFNELKSKYSSTFNKVFEKQKNWLLPVEEKLNLLNDKNSEDEFTRLITILKDDNAYFDNKDIGTLELFPKKIVLP